MDIFNTDDQSGNNLPDPETIKLEDLVGEGKKYANPNELAKAYLHSDRHIAELRASAEALKQDLTSRETLDEALKKFQEMSGKTPTANTMPSGEPVSTPEQDKGFTLEDVDKRLAELRQKEAADSNINDVQTKIREFTGSDDAAVKYVQEKAKSLGISVTKLRELSAESPSTTLKLLDIGVKPADQSTGLRNYKPSERSELNPNNPTTLADYTEMRRKNPNKFYQPSVQAAWFKLAQAEKAKELSNR